MENMLFLAYACINSKVGQKIVLFFFLFHYSSSQMHFLSFGAFSVNNTQIPWKHAKDVLSNQDSCLIYTINYNSLLKA